MSLIRDGNWTVRPGNQVVLIRRESNHVDEGVRKPPLADPRRTSPKLNTLSMYRGQICAERRPLHESFSPAGPIDNILRCVLVVIPEHTDAIAAVHDELVPAATAGVGHERPQMLLLLERLDLGRRVLVVNLALPAIVVDIGKLVDAQGVPLVESDQVKLSHSSGGLGFCRILDEGEASTWTLEHSRFQTWTLGPHTSWTCRPRPWACRSDPRGSCRRCSASSRGT